MFLRPPVFVKPRVIICDESENGDTLFIFLLDLNTIKQMALYFYQLELFPSISQVEGRQRLS